MPALGRFPLPIEVNRFGLGATRRALERVARAHFGAEGGLELRLGRRRAAASSPTAGTSSSMLFLAAFRSQKPFRPRCYDVPGVVEHGLFLKLCRRAYVAGPDGVETIDA